MAKQYKWIPETQPSLQIQASALNHYDMLVTELGGNAEKLANEQGINLANIDVRKGRINIERHIQLIEHTAKELNEPSFGMLLGSRQEAYFAIGDLGRLLQSCSTIRQVIEVGSALSSFHNEAELWQLETHGATAILRRIDLYHDEIDTRQHREMAMAVCIKLFRVLISERLAGVRIELTHKQIASSAAYASNFGVPTSFNSEREAIVFPSRYLQQGIHSADSERLKLLEQRIKSHQIERPTFYTEKVHAIIKQTLGWREANIGLAAETLNIHARTLQRKLKAEGTSYNGLLTNIRMDMACRYLAYSDIDITILSVRLGYQEVGNFSRAFKTFLGVSPREWRKLELINRNEEKT